jgi:DNA replication protein DnaC
MAQQDHLTSPEALLGAEVEERTRRLIARRIQEAPFPVLKTVEEFAFAEAPTIPAATVRTLAEGAYLAAAEPVLFLGEPGTGKTHLALGVAACRQRRRVRFTTAAALVNDLVEAQHQPQVSRVLNRWARVELIVIDELAYVAVADLGAALLFQLIAERAEKAAVIAPTNLPFSEGTSVFPNARLCKALLDRLTDRAHIIDTGSDSYRFRRSLEQRQGKPRSKPRARESPPPSAPGVGKVSAIPSPREAREVRCGCRGQSLKRDGNRRDMISRALNT